MKKASKTSSKAQNMSDAKNPLISVIIPVYNVENYLDKCLEFVANQTYKNLEIILIDDGSTDNSGKMCDEWAKKDKRIRVFHQENKGVSAARNLGVAKSKSNYISFVDSDDEAYSDYIETLYQDLRKNDCDISMVKHWIIYPTRRKKAFTNKSTVFDNPRDCIREILLCKDVDVSPWGKLYKKALFDGIKYPEGKIFEDAAMTPILLMRAKKIFLNSTPHYNYIIRSNSLSQSSFNPNKLDLISATKSSTELILEKYPDLCDECNIRILHAYLSTIRVLAISKSSPKDIKGALINGAKKYYRKIENKKLIPKQERFATETLFASYKLFSRICIIRERALA